MDETCPLCIGEKGGGGGGPRGAASWEIFFEKYFMGNIFRRAGRDLSARAALEAARGLLREERAERQPELVLPPPEQVRLRKGARESYAQRKLRPMTSQMQPHG